MGGGSHKKENQISRLENWKAVLLDTKIVQLDLSHREKRNGKSKYSYFYVIPLPAQIYHINKYFANGFSVQTFDSNSQTLLCGRLEGICKRPCQSVACKF